MAKKLAKKRKGRQFWTAQVERFEQMEGVTQREFTEREGLVFGTFRHWLYQLRAERADAQMTAVHFVEVDHQALNSPDRATIVEIGEVRLHLDGLPDPRWLVEVADRLRGGQPC